MGRGKKTKSLPLKEKSKVSCTVNSSTTARNLTKNELGAVIFGCKNHTFTECVKKMMFGLPAGHYSYVKNISPGLTLFLFNYSDRKLHGIFEATSCAKLNGDLYIFGGGDDGIWYDTVESYNPMSNQWVQRPSLSKKKGSLAGASLYEKIYAIGGGNGVECFSEVELFDLNIGSWIPAQSMLEKRFSHAAADINGALYVAGGYNGRDYLRSVERFDPREHAWTRLGSMNVKRGCHSLVAFKERLYALGGYKDTMVSTVDVLDPRFGSWLLAEPMKVSRGYFGSFVFGGKIHVIGGLVGTEVLDVSSHQTECYDKGSGWQVGGRTAIVGFLADHGLMSGSLECV